jgi:hypothetical protein
MSVHTRIITDHRRFERRHVVRATLTVFGFCVLFTGCSRSARAPVYPAHGQVFLNGKPLAEAIVTFHHERGNDTAPLPSGHTDAEGHYKLTSYATGDGAPEGTYGISLVCFRAQPIRKGGDSDATNVVPARYANAATSKLKATIVRGDNELPSLQLKSP